jgi:hypothetical protein
MRKEIVEIYSDVPNAAVLRHPNRKFPGFLIQGDTLHALCVRADEICDAREGLSPDVFQKANELRNTLWGMLNHYSAALGEHDIPLPYSTRP